MGQRKRAAGAILAATALTATAACGAFGGDAEESDDETRLVEMINEGNRLDAELTEAEYRVVQACLEEQGHTVHDQWELQAWTPSEQETLSDYSATDTFLPDADIAAKWGFGNWSNTEEGWDSGEAEEYQDEMWGEDEDPMGDVDNSEFESLPMEEQYDWYIAYHGEAYAEEYYGWMLDEDAGDEFAEDELGDEEFAEGEGAPEGGELELEDESWNEPEPGGCKLEMIEALYGAPEQIEEDDVDGGGFSYWSWGPESPEMDSDWEELTLNYRDKTQDEEYAFFDCVAERGYGDWTLNEWGDLPLWEYFDQIYYEDGDSRVSYAGGSDGEYPDPPEDLPSDFEGKKAYEIAMAVDFVECGDETGYKEAADKAWNEVQLEHYLAMEEDYYAWQDEVREAITKAQELIDS